MTASTIMSTCLAYQVHMANNTTAKTLRMAASSSGRTADWFLAGMNTKGEADCGSARS